MTNTYNKDLYQEDGIIYICRCIYTYNMCMSKHKHTHTLYMQSTTAMENHPFIDDVPIKTPFIEDFSLPRLTARGYIYNIHIYMSPDSGSPAPPTPPMVWSPTLTLSGTRDTGPYIPTYLHTFKHTYIHSYIHTYLSTYLPTYPHTYIPTYLRTHVHTYIHT